jgi:8-amino-7-oxononanoate synthase
VAADLARLLGCESATLGTSTLHLVFDLFDVLSGEGVAILADGGCYPILIWGLEHAAARGVPVGRFPSHQPDALARRLARGRRSGLRSVVVTDGLCPFTGRAAPLGDYLRLVQAEGGLLVVDDTQAMGIIGADPSAAAPLGLGGGGTPAWLGVQGPGLVLVSSLAKGLGAPLAVLAGGRWPIERVERLGPTRVHCSPPSAAHIAAAAHALGLNRHQGDALRHRLTLAVRRFRQPVLAAGIEVEGGPFPVQTPLLGAAAESVHRALLAAGIRTLLRESAPPAPPALSFLIAATHRPWEIDRAAESVVRFAERLGVGR